MVLPICTWEPSRTPALVDPVAVDEHAVGRAEVVHLELEVASPLPSVRTSNSTCRRLTPGSLIRRSASVPRPTTRPGGCSGWRVPLTSRTARARRTWVWVALLGAPSPAPGCGSGTGRWSGRRPTRTRSRPGRGRRSSASSAWSWSWSVSSSARAVSYGASRSRSAGELDVEVVGHQPPLAGRGSARCCRTRAGARPRSRPAAPHCGRRGRRRRRSSARAGARSSAVRPRRLLPAGVPIAVVMARHSRGGTVSSVGHRAAVAHDCIGVRSPSWTPLDAVLFCRVTRHPVNLTMLAVATPDIVRIGPHPVGHASTGVRRGQAFWSPPHRWANLAGLHARVAEQADAHGSGPCVRKDVGVQLPPRAPWSGRSAARSAR